MSNPIENLTLGQITQASIVLGMDTAMLLTALESLRKGTELEPKEAKAPKANGKVPSIPAPTGATPQDRMRAASKASMSEVDRQVLIHIASTKGGARMAGLKKALGLSRDEIKPALERLEASGRIERDGGKGAAQKYRKR